MDKYGQYDIYIYDYNQYCETTHRLYCLQIYLSLISDWISAVPDDWQLRLRHTMESMHANIDTIPTRGGNRYIIIMLNTHGYVLVEWYMWNRNILITHPIHVFCNGVYYIISQNPYFKTNCWLSCMHFLYHFRFISVTQMIDNSDFKTTHRSFLGKIHCMHNSGQRWEQVQYRLNTHVYLLVEYKYFDNT